MGSILVANKSMLIMDAGSASVRSKDQFFFPLTMIGIMPAMIWTVIIATKCPMH